MWCTDIEVKQGGFDSSEAPVRLWTHGLGPCVGAAIAWKNRALMIHDEAPQHDGGTRIADFITKAKELFPDEVRPMIRPVVAGGAHDRDLGTEPTEVSREALLEILRRLDLGEPRIHWGNPDDVLGLEVDFERKRIVVTDSDDRERKSYRIGQT